jgi:hypothetical protein
VERDDARYAEPSGDAEDRGRHVDQVLDVHDVRGERASVLREAPADLALDGVAVPERPSLRLIEDRHRQAVPLLALQGELRPQPRREHLHFVTRGEGAGELGRVALGAAAVLGREVVDDLQDSHAGKTTAEVV